MFSKNLQDEVGFKTKTSAEVVQFVHINARTQTHTRTHIQTETDELIIMTSGTCELRYTLITMYN